MLTNGKPFFKRLVTHPLVASIEDTKISKLSKDLINLNDIISGPQKLNDQRLHGHGVDIVRALVCTITGDMDEPITNL